MRKSRTSAVRRERRKSELLLKKGLIREPQRGVGHHIVSNANHVVTIPQSLNKKAKKIEPVAQPLLVSLSEFFSAFSELFDDTKQKSNSEIHVHKFTAMPVPRYNLQPPPTHTSFSVLFCSCGHAEVNPPNNFALLSDEQRAHFIQHLFVEFGLVLEWPNHNGKENSRDTQET